MPADLTRKPHLGKAQCMLGILSQEGLLCDVSIQSGPQGPSFSNPTFIVRSHHPCCRATYNNSGKGAWKCSFRTFLLTAIFMASTLPDKMCFQGHLKATHLWVKYPGPELHLPVSKGLKLFLHSQMCIECVLCAGYCGEPWRHTVNEVGFLPLASLRAGTMILRL